MAAPRTKTVSQLVAAVGSGGGPSLRLQSALDHVSGEVRYFSNYETLREGFAERQPTLVVLELPELTADRLNAEIDRMRRTGIRAPVFVISDGIVPNGEPVSLDDIIDFANAAATPPEIVARVTRVLDRLSAAQPLELMSPMNEPARKTYGVLIDWRTREATYEGSTVRFSTAELRMFEALLQKGGGLLATEELLEVVWGDRPPRSPGLVSVYIWALRGKLARLSKSFTIETRVGSGYRLTIGVNGPRKRKSSGPRKGSTRKSA